MPSLSPVRGTSTRVVALTEDSPSPREAARRLARFTEEVVVVREPSLISSPPTPSKQTLPLRSRRIAAQKMDHIPASKRGKLLLKKKLGLLEPSTPPASMAKRSYESYFKGNLSTVDVEALDKLFQLAEGCPRS